MEKAKLTFRIREKSGKSASRKLKREGFIPAILYSKDINLKISIKKEELLKLMHLHPSLESIMIELCNQDSEETYTSIVKDIQYHPLSDEIIHIDFKKISLHEKIRVKVPVIPKGEAKGVKQGGILEHFLREVEIECLPQDAPEKVEIDVSELDIGDVFHIEDLKLPSNLKVVEDPKEVIFTCVAPHKEEEEEKPVEEEPEVIKEKKPESKEEE